ncbi:hypothetical protein ABW20_dc0107604 [Dactylellina cionopaga]|nr:hypothetical protein ABW20_dc0107604 [Dactylellina cionopaga]
MKFAIIALATATAVSAQLVFTDDGQFQCLGSAAGKNFCAGDSLQTNIIIRCTGTKGQPGNCNDNLAGIPPVGVKSFAPCYQTSNTTGDAACSFNGIAYPDSGNSFPIPGASSSSSAVASSSVAAPTYGASSSSVAVPTYGASSSSVPVVYPTTTVEPTTTAIVYPTYPAGNTTATYPTSSLITLTGTVTVTTCSGASCPPTYTAPPAPPSNNGTTYTSSLPTPTQAPNGAGALVAKNSIVLGAVAVLGFMFL